MDPVSQTQVCYSMAVDFMELTTYPVLFSDVRKS